MLPEFNKKIHTLQMMLNRVKENNSHIRDMKSKILKATLGEQEKSISEDLNRRIDENTRFCKAIKEQIEALEIQAAEARQTDPNEPETRIMNITCKAIKSKFAEVLKESQTVQVDYKTAVRSKMERQVRVMDPTLSNEDVEEIVNDPEGAKNLMTAKLMGPGHIKLRHAVADIQDKHRDILKLERSVQTIHQMFVDMAMMVHQQGEMLDNIEVNVGQAVDYMRKANVELKKAKKWHMRSKRMMCCILITCLIIIAVAVALPIALRSIG